MITKAKAEQERQSWWHWQNLNDHRDGTQGSGLLHGRCWWHFRSNGRYPNEPSPSICLEWRLFGTSCCIGFDIDDENLTLSLAIPLLLAVYLSFDTSFRWVWRLAPKKPLTYYPDTIVVDERECKLAIHSGRVWINPWSKRNATVSADPWWIRGISFSVNPFEYKFMRHEGRCADGTWVLIPDWKIGESQPVPQAEILELPYTYILRSGEQQHRIATVKVERRAWRPRCLRVTSLFEMVRTCIDVKFSDEVGEETGSWKGGCVGCGYTLLPNESVEACLRRMESERKF